MIEHTKEQKGFLILVGSPDDGSRSHMVLDGEQHMNELMGMGLLYQTGKNSFDFTDEGERLYGELTGEDVT